MSWDIKALVVLALTWALLAAIDLLGLAGMVMIEAARAWGAGSLIFLAIMAGVRYAEYRGAQAVRHADWVEPQAERLGARVGPVAGVASEAGGDG